MEEKVLVIRIKGHKECLKKIKELKEELEQLNKLMRESVELQKLLGLYFDFGMTVRASHFITDIF